MRLDQDPCGGATDIVWNIAHGIPLPDWSVSELFTSHFLEHLVPTDAHYVLQEIYRVCAPNALVTIKLPHGDTPEGHLPCHYMRWTEATMKAINQWFPHDSGTYFDMKRVWREDYHLIAEYRVVKPWTPPNE